MSQETMNIPTPVRKARVNIMDEIGSSGLKAYGGYVYEEFLPQLTGDKALKTYREMKDNDPVVAAILFAVDMLIRQVDWHVEPASSSADDLEKAKFLDQCINDMTVTWKDVVSEALTMLPYGWSFMEIVYKKRDGYQGEGGDSSNFDDGRIGWKKFAHRPQDSLYRWAFDETGGTRAMLQTTQPDYRIATIPIEKGLLFRTVSSKNNPSGRSILRGAYRPWYFKKRIEEIEAIGIERDLAGLPIAMVDPALLRADASDDDKALLNSIKELVVNVRRDQQEGVIFPMSYDANGQPLFQFQLMTSGGSRQFSIESVIDRYSKQIAMTVMADFIFLGHQGTGSYALSSDKTSLFAKSLGVWLDVIQDTFNRYAVPRLMRVNGMEADAFPRMVHGDIETPNLMELSDYVTKLAGIGINLLPDERMESYLRGVAHLPQKTDELIEDQEQKRDQQTQMQQMQMQQMQAQTQQMQMQAEASQYAPPQAAAQAYQSMAQAQAAGADQSQLDGLASGGGDEFDAGEANLERSRLEQDDGNADLANATAGGAIADADENASDRKKPTRPRKMKRNRRVEEAMAVTGDMEDDSQAASERARFEQDQG